MTTPTLALQTGALGSAATRVDAARADLARLSSSLTSTLTSTMQRWQGQGATSFRALHEMWEDRHRMLLASLDDLALSLRAIERDTAATDEALSRGFGTAGVEGVR